MAHIILTTTQSPRDGGIHAKFEKGAIRHSGEIDSILNFSESPVEFGGGGWAAALPPGDGHLAAGHDAERGL